MKNYDHLTIEKKWQDEWEKSGIYNTPDNVPGKENFYTLTEFTYPSGNLHVGHWYAFSVPDIFARYKRMQGFNVLYPTGFDAFGLPAENAAIKLGADPKVLTYEQMDRMRTQIKSMGGMFDWSREVVTCDPEYYKWTQWMFNQFLKHDLAYRAVTKVNWCPKDQTVLANEQVTDGKCERCGTEVVQKDQEQWMLRITKYADRLIDDLDNLDWPHAIKESQKNWIGRSEGSELEFTIVNSDQKIKVFTTRADTLFGVTYVVLAPEHELVSKLLENVSNKEEVQDYVSLTKKKQELERQQSKDKTGVELKGVKVINPANNEEVPVWIADYVLAGYGTGAVMAVPRHDTRDYEFSTHNNLNKGEFVVARKHALCGIYSSSIENLESIKSIKSISLSYEEKIKGHLYFFYFNNSEILNLLPKIQEALKDDGQANISTTGLFIELRKNETPRPVPIECDPNEGFLINSGKFDGMTSDEAKKKITEFVGGKLVSTYRLRDWGISRQRYWGCPIPIVYDPEGNAHSIPDEHLPWILPTDVDHTPDGTAPLARSKELLERTEKIFGKGWKPEVETMDTFVDSSWYFYRYLDSKDNAEFASTEKMNAWMPVDMYMGGAEHTTMHVLYSRFWTKALQDLGFVKDSEAYKVRRNRGLILGPDGNKMSKSKGNVINPDEIVELLGADTVRMYLAFMGPYGVTVNYPWDPNGVVGVRRFLERVWKLGQKIVNEGNPLLPGEGGLQSKPGEVLLHKTIKGITEDVEEFKFNTAISKMMILINAWEKEDSVSGDDYKILLQLLSPFAPHITDELWSELGEKNSIHLSQWPTYDAKLVIDDTVTIGIQINGKVRAEIELAKDADQESVREKVLAMDEVKKWIEVSDSKEIKKFIYVPGKIISIVV